MEIKDTPSMVRIYSRDEFLSAAYTSANTEKAESLSPMERFYGGIYSELFEDTRFLFNQYTKFYDDDDRKSDCMRIETRLGKKLSAFSENTNLSMPHVEIRLQSFYTSDVATAVWILSSIDFSPALGIEKALQYFHSSEPTYRPDVVMGLKHGKHPELSSHIAIMAKSVDESLASDLNDILAFREKRHGKDI